MGRDHRKLVVFTLADRLVTDIYRTSQGFPASERFGLQTQMRRAAVSAVSNIVEGSARRTTREYLNFLHIAAGSAAEVAYLAELAGRLGLLNHDESQRVGGEYGELVARLQSLIKSLANQP